MVLDRELELEEEYENSPLPEYELPRDQGPKGNFWQPTEQTCPTLLIKDVSGFASFDYRLRPAHYKTLLDLLEAVKGLVDEAKKNNALQSRFIVSIRGLSDRVGQPEVEDGVSIMRALEVARFIERALPRVGLHRAEPPKSRTDDTPPASIEEIAMFISAGGSAEHLVGTPAANRRVVISVCAQQV
jgi:hypothetical protein